MNAPSRCFAALLAALAVAIGTCIAPASASSWRWPAALEFVSADGVRVHAERDGTAHDGRPLVLLFHQAGSNLHEYDAIAPRLTDLGFNALAIDQRSGGDFYPPSNVTVDRRGGSDANYLAALPDLEAALRYAVGAQSDGHGRAPILVWGSSYSAALVFELAAEHPHDVDALLAFSPGEYFDDKHGVHAAAQRLRRDLPVFVDSAADASEEAAATSIARAVPSRRVTLFVPTAGIHGSSTLDATRDPDGYVANWSAVARFLRSLRLAEPDGTSFSDAVRAARRC